MHQLLWFIYRDVFTVGVALINGTGNNAIITANAVGDYSYFIARNVTGRKEIIARCVTGLGPSGNDNSVLGELYFDDTKIEHEQKCAESQYIQSKSGSQTAGVLNIRQCSGFSTSVEDSVNAEGVYTCKMKNSAMLNESIRFGIYFSGRSK